MRRLASQTHPARRLGCPQELILTRAGTRCWRTGVASGVWRIALYPILLRGGGGIDGSFLLLRSGPANPGPSEIGKVSKYVLCYGRKCVEPPKTHRQIWRDAVLGCDERSGPKVICTKLLNTTDAMEMIKKAERIVEAGHLPLWGCTAKFREVSLHGFRKLQKDGGAGTHTTPLNKYRGRAPEDGNISLYEYVCRPGEVTVFTGAALRPQFPPPEGFARDATSAQAVARGRGPHGGKQRTHGFQNPTALSSLNPVRWL